MNNGVDKNIQGLPNKDEEEPEKDWFEQLDKEKTTSREWIEWRIKDIKSNWYNFKYGVRNLFKWFNLVWQDRDWDYAYSLKALKFKLEQQHKCMLKDETLVDSDYFAARIKTTVNLLDKIMEGFYAHEYSDYLEVKMWFTPIKDDPKGGSVMHSRILSENLDAYFGKYPNIYKKFMKGKTKVYFGFGEEDEKDTKEHKRTIAMNIGVINAERAEDLLYKILRSELGKWWQ